MIGRAVLIKPPRLPKRSIIGHMGRLYRRSAHSSSFLAVVDFDVVPKSPRGLKLESQGGVKTYADL